MGMHHRWRLKSPSPAARATDVWCAWCTVCSPRKDDWDDELESFETGWPGFFEVLRVYLNNFPGQSAAAVHALVSRPGGDAEVWSRLTSALNLSGANVGDRCESPSGAPRLGGTVARVHQDANAREVMLRLDAPCDGVAVIGSCAIGDESRGIASLFFYGGHAADTAAAEQRKWSTWLRGLFEEEPVTP